MKPHGLLGEVVVVVHSDAPDRFAPGAQVLVSSTPDRVEMTIAASRWHRQRLLVRFEGVEDRDSAEALRGLDLFIPKSRAVPADPDAHLVADLVGSSVRDMDGNELGTLEKVIAREGQDLWEVGTSSGSVLVPAVKEFVVDVDEESHTITLDPPEGLFER